MPECINKRTGISIGLLVLILGASSGLLAVLADMRSDLRALSVTMTRMHIDRWTKADDEIYMMQFANENKLSMPNHKRTVPTH